MSLRTLGPLALLSFGALTACGNFVQIAHYQVDQAALVPASAGPHAVGPLVPGQRGAVEASGSFATAIPSGRNRASGQPGHVIPYGVGRLRGAYGIAGRAEIGADLEITSGMWAGSTSADVPNQQLASAVMFRGGAQFRVLFAGTRALGLGINAEASLATVPYQRVVTTSLTYRVLDPTITSPLPPDSVRTASYNRSVAVPYGRIGVFFTGAPSSSVHVLGGVLVQNQAYFPGRQTLDSTCVYPSGSVLPAACSGGRSEDDLPVFVHELVVTPWLGLGYTIGPVTLIGQLHANISPNYALMMGSPFGGDLGVRFGF